jgi:phosphohistidine phosphatase SixA
MADRDTVQLHLLRHAHAGDPEGWTGPDAARPLSAKGEQQAERVGQFLADAGFKADIFITSPKIRAARTAEIVADALDCEVREDERLARDFDLVTIEAILFDAGEPVKPVLVGHDPDFSEVAAALVGAPSLSLRKGAFARFDADRPLVAGSGTLRWLVSPDLLGGRYAR